MLFIIYSYYYFRWILLIRTLKLIYNCIYISIYLLSIIIFQPINFINWISILYYILYSIINLIGQSFIIFLKHLLYDKFFLNNIKQNTNLLLLFYNFFIKFFFIIFILPIRWLIWKIITTIIKLINRINKFTYLLKWSYIYIFLENDFYLFQILKKTLPYKSSTFIKSFIILNLLFLLQKYVFLIIIFLTPTPIISPWFLFLMEVFYYYYFIIKYLYYYYIINSSLLRLEKIYTNYYIFIPNTEYETPTYNFCILVEAVIPGIIFLVNSLLVYFFFIELGLFIPPHINFNEILHLYLFILNFSNQELSWLVSELVEILPDTVHLQYYKIYNNTPIGKRPDEWCNQIPIVRNICEKEL